MGAIVLKQLVTIILILSLIMPSTVTVFANGNEQPITNVILSDDWAIHDEVVFIVVLVYFAFGLERNTNDRNTNPFRYSSEYMDWERGGEYYLRRRSFNPRTGRFTQPDPLWTIENMIFGYSPTMRNDRYMPNIHAILQSGNLYVYAINNPIMWVDPSGESILGAIAAAGATVALALRNLGSSTATTTRSSTSAQRPNQITQQAAQATPRVVPQAPSGSQQSTPVAQRIAPNATRAAGNARASSTQSTLNLTNQIQNINGKYQAPKHVVNQIGQQEARGANFSQLQRKIVQSRPSTEGGTSRVVMYSDNKGTKFVIHEVTNSSGKIIHRDFDAVRIESGQIINAPGR